MQKLKVFIRLNQQFKLLLDNYHLSHHRFRFHLLYPIRVSPLNYQIDLPVQSDALYQVKIKELLEENQKLIHKSSMQDLIINRLQQIEELEPTRSSRINTLNNTRNNSKKQINKIQNFVYTSQKESKDDKLLFTFYSPEPNQKTNVCKLPKVFQVIPKKRKYFI